jgi:hypothetical protein
MRSCLSCGERLDDADQHIIDKAIVEAQAEHDTLQSELSASQEREARLREALGMDAPFPVFNLLEKLANVADHLLDNHNCDCKGHEAMRYCATRAKETAQAIRDALADAPAPVDTKPVAEAAHDLYISIVNGAYDGPEDVEVEQLGAALKSAGYEVRK